MKVIKKYFKVVMCFMAFALCSFLMVFAPTMTALSVEAAITDYARTINSVHMPKQVDVENDGKLIIPFLKGSFSADGSYAIKVVDPAGHAHTCKVTSAGEFVEEQQVKQDGNGFFAKTETGIQVVALTNGNYQIVYVVTEGTGDDAKEFYSNIYNVNVKNVSYELDFTKADGSINLIKPEVAPSEETIDRIEIPVPTAKIVGSDKAGTAIDPEKEISVSYNGTTVKLSETGELTDFVKVNVGTTADPEYKYYIQPSKAGIYKIQYTYKRGVNRPTKTITIKVSENFEEPNEFKVSTAPSFDKFELGQTGITLPKLTAKNEYQNDVAYNVKSIKIVKESDSTISQELTNNNYKFDMTLKAFNLTDATDTYDKLKGNYVITYTLVDAYGNETDYTKRIEGVTVSSKPTIKMVYDYEADGTMKEGNFVTSAETINADTQLQNKYGYDEIILPAAYAEDNVSKSNELIVVRYLRNVNTSTIYYVDNLKYNSSTGELEEVKAGDVGYNYAAVVDAEDYVGDADGLAKAQAEAAKIGHINQAVKFKFSSDDDKAKTNDGTYQLEYRVIAKNIKKRESTLTVSGSTKYTFTVIGYSLAPTEDMAPTVEITNIVNNIYVDRNEELTVNFTATDDDDTRLKNAVYYYYGNKSAANIAKDIKDRINKHNDNTMHVLDKDALLEDLAKDDNTLSPAYVGYTGITKAELNEAGTGYVVKFDTTGDNKAAEKAVIVAISYNDYNNISVDTRTVNFKKTGEEDKVAPVVSEAILGTGCSFEWDDVNDNYKLKETAVIGDTVVLPELVYTDAGDDTLLTNISYYIDSPLNTNTGLSYLSPYAKKYPGKKIVGGKIDIAQGGNYVVVYSATDDAGNTTVTYFTFEVERNSKPIFSVNPVGNDITISGNTVTAEVGSTISFDTILRDGDSKNIINGTVTVDIDDNGLDYSASGDRDMSYIFNSVGTYTLTFSADDAVDKVVYVNITAKKLEWLDEFSLPEYADTNSDIYLPDIAASDNAVVKVTVTPPNGSKLEKPVEKVSIEIDQQGKKASYWYFKTNDAKGNYTIKYTATTADATLEKTFTIKVGDNVPPTIKFEHKAELEKDIVYDGSNQIQIKFDVKKTGAVEDRYFKIKATSNGETIYSYDLGMKITDITDGSSNATTMYWSDLKYEIVGDSSLKQDTEDENLYLISGTGTYTIKLSIKDANGNETVESIVFKVVDKSEVEEKNDTVVGIVLIVISLVVLAGVILFFMLTGKKGGSKKGKKVVKQAKAKAEKLENKKEEKVEAEKVEEVVEETPATEEVAEAESTEENTEAKEGEIEE